MAENTIGEPSVGGGTSVAEHPEHHRGPLRRHPLRSVLGAVVVVLALLTAWFVFGGERAMQSSEDEARQRLGSAPSAPATTRPADAAPLTGPPTPGLYRYEGSGKENTSFPPLAESQGPQMPATVTAAANGCWTVRIDYNTHHWQTWTYCTANGQLTETAGSSFARRDFGGVDLDNTSTFACDPPAMIFETADPAGTTHPRTCTGSGTLVPEKTTVTGTMKMIGNESIDVGGTSVLTTHVRYELTYSGGQTGNETSDMWFATATGLPVKNTRSITVNTDTPVGRITYTENAEFRLTTPTPV